MGLTGPLRTKTECAGIWPGLDRRDWPAWKLDLKKLQTSEPLVRALPSQTRIADCHVSPLPSTHRGSASPVPFPLPLLCPFPSVPFPAQPEERNGMYQEPLAVTFDASAPPWPPLDRGRNRGSPKRDKSLNFLWGPVPPPRWPPPGPHISSLGLSSSGPES